MRIEVESSIWIEDAPYEFAVLEQVVRPDSTVALLGDFFFENRADLRELWMRARIAAEERHDSRPVSDGANGFSEAVESHVPIVTAERKQARAVRACEEIARRRDLDLDDVV